MPVLDYQCLLVRLAQQIQNTHFKASAVVNDRLSSRVFEEQTGSKMLSPPLQTY